MGPGGLSSGQGAGADSEGREDGPDRHHTLPAQPAAPVQAQRHWRVAKGPGQRLQPAGTSGAQVSLLFPPLFCGI
eukprot:scaffold248187_cov30-Prasinocladus_malaysianus.AAC.1